MEHIEIRKATNQDIDNGLLEAFIDGYQFHQEGRPDIFKIQSEEELKDKLLKDLERLEVLVAVHKNEVVGYLAYEIQEKHSKNLYIDQLAIRESFRDKGFGRKLMDEAKKIATDIQCKRIVFNAWTFNEKALSIYDHMGFHRQRILYEMDLGSD